MQASNAGAMLDPNSYMNPPNNSFDPSQFHNAQMQQRIQNGNMRNASPSFPGPAPYQTSSIIPSKRSRPIEDTMSASPRQATGMMPGQYAHLQQNGSANASPSPIMNNQLRPNAIPQRVSTASPHPYSPAGQHFAPQASPSQSEQGNRTDTPLNYMQNSTFQPPYNQPYPSSNRGSVGSVGPVNGMPTTPMSQPQHPMQQPPPQMFQQGRPSNMMDMQNQLMQQQMRRQQQPQPNLANTQRMHNMPATQGSMPRPPMPNTSGQYGSGPGPGTTQRPPVQQSRPNDINRIFQGLINFMQLRGQHVEHNPMIGDRQIHIIMIFQAVIKHGGYKKVTGMNHWPQVVQMLQVNPMQYPSAPQQLKSVYEQNLMAFEDEYQRQQSAAKQKQMMQQNQMDGAPQMSPMKQMSSGPANQNAPPYMAQSTPPSNLPSHQGMPMKPPNQQPAMNGYVNPGTQPNSTVQARNGMSRPDNMPQRGPLPPGSSSSERGTIAAPSTTSSTAPAAYEMPKEYAPISRSINTYGGIGGLDQMPDSLSSLANGINFHRPNVPSFHEMGIVDIHAVTMSLKSGIQSETRLALDTLATLSVEPTIQLDLRACDDLVESLVDHAEEQVDLLAENAAEVSDVMLITSYEDVVRGCRQERDGLLRVPEFGSPEYNLDRAVERLICITTIIRNLSFIDANHPPLADELLIKFLCTVVRYLGTRNMLLRTNAHTLDFMKDIIIFLSNLAFSIEIPGQEQALCLLHFLLAFAPSSPSFDTISERVNFSSYDPSVHRYLPPAVDSLAKLLARDEPNRTFYKAIFAADSNSTPPYDLLTKAFGLAIAPVPAYRQEDQRLSPLQVIEARKPQLMQGMLAADILANLAPGYETNVAKSWLTSEDGFAQSLLQMVTILSTAAPLPQRGPQQGHNGDDVAIQSITLSAISVLKRLSTKALNPNDVGPREPMAWMIKQESLLGALLLTTPRPEIIKQLCAYAVDTR